MKTNSLHKISVKQHLRVMFTMVVIFALVSVFSVFQLKKAANFHRLNSLHLKYVNMLDKNLFGPDNIYPSRQNIIDITVLIREQPIACLKQINMFDRWFMQYIGSGKAISLCEQDIVLANEVLTRLYTLDIEYLSDIKLMRYLRNSSMQFTRHSKEFELHITKVVDKIIQYSFWLTLPVLIMLIVLTIAIYQHVTQHAENIRKATDALTEAQMENWRMAFFDDLTGLPNRNLLNDRLGEAIKDASRNNKKIAVMFLDLDRFKHVNDTYGHAVGDKLIYEAAVRFSSHLRKSDTLARFGGDEFVLLVEDLRHDEDIGKVANKLIQSINKNFIIDGNHLSVSTSIGISMYPKDGEDAESLLKSADVAMYVSKSRGKNQYCIHDEKIKRKAGRLSRIEDRLKNALKEQSLSIVYQPVIDLKTMRIKGAEALLRWHDKVLGNVSPEEFISVAEDTGQIIKIGKWVYMQACAKVIEWRNLYGEDIYLSVNVSGRQLKDENFVKFIQKTLEKYNLPATAINLEITESVFYSNDQRSVKTINELKNIGVILLLDDFGTGYSSLSTLTSLPFDFVKIDKSFLMHAKEKDLMTTNTIIDMAKNFNMGVIAEGVEHANTVSFLKERKCEFAQGFLFSKPCPAEEIDFSKDYSSLLQQRDNEEIRYLPKTA